MKYLQEKGNVFSNVSMHKHSNSFDQVQTSCISSIEDEEDIVHYYGSNCNGSDIPDHIDASTAYFDDEGNYAGGVYKDESEF